MRLLHGLGLCAIALAACTASAPEGTTERAAAGAGAVADPHSFANVADFRTRHLELDLETDFQARRLSGTVDLSIERLDGAARALVLDTRDLTVSGAWLLGAGADPVPLEIELGDADPIRGAPLTVALPAEGAGESFQVRIAYRTSPQASALQWLAPEQTAGKTHPFLFTQSQAIHARSWIPLQDTPQVRTTYRATIRVPAGLRAVMSADNDPDGGTAGPGELTTYRFEMPQPIPSYLIALGVGRLEFQSTGPRTGVYAEPPVVAAAAREFADLETMLETCERLFGPYRWGRYDLLILPPSFPFGGMENPRLSFITPTIIAGDRSLVALIAHELAHSWSGNLVTNATWRDLWLNEGFTVYLERRIVEALYGAERARMEDVLGLQSLQRDFADLKPANQALLPDLRGRDPDDVFSEVPYEKGKLLLQWLESRFGRERLDAFLRDYFAHFAFRSITTEQFLDYLRANLLSSEPGRVTERQLEAWLREPGLPEFAVLPRSDAFARVDEQRRRWLEGAIAAEALPAGQWSTHEWLHFLDNFPASVPRARLEELDRAFALTESPNAEVAHSWLRVAIRNGYEPAWPRLERYLTTIGRRKLIRPLYEDLMKSEAGAERARRIYAEARPGYHPIAVATLDPIVLQGSAGK